MSSDAADPVFEKLSKVLVKVLGKEIEPVRLGANLIDEYDANSMDLVDMADQAEDAFRITFRTEDLKEMKTVGDVLAYIKTKLP